MKRGLGINVKKLVMTVALAVAVFGVAYINYSISTTDEKDTPVNANAEGIIAEASKAASSDYFAVFRTEREQTRDKEIDYIDAIIGSTETDEDTKNEATEQKLSIISCMEQELAVEGIIQSKLNMEAVVTVKEGAVSVVVGKSVLTSEEVTQIADIVKTHTGEPTQNIKIMPQS